MGGRGNETAQVLQALHVIAVASVHPATMSERGGKDLTGKRVEGAGRMAADACYIVCGHVAPVFPVSLAQVTHYTRIPIPHAERADGLLHSSGGTGTYWIGRPRMSVNRAAISWKLMLSGPVNVNIWSSNVSVTVLRSTQSTTSRPSTMASLPSPVPKYSLPSLVILRAVMTRRFCIIKGGRKMV